jgi:hypothetical protein
MRLRIAIVMIVVSVGAFIVKHVATRIRFACISTPDQEYSAVLHKKQHDHALMLQLKKDEDTQ